MWCFKTNFFTRPMYFRSSRSHFLVVSVVFVQFCQMYFSHSETVFWGKLQCKRERWKEQSPQPFPDCLCFLNVYSTVNFHLPAPSYFSSRFFLETSYLFLETSYFSSYLFLETSSFSLHFFTNLVGIFFSSFQLVFYPLR